MNSSDLLYHFQLFCAYSMAAVMVIGKTTEFLRAEDKECVTFRSNGDRCYILETEVKKVKNTPLVESDQDK